MCVSCPAGGHNCGRKNSFFLLFSFRGGGGGGGENSKKKTGGKNRFKKKKVRSRPLHRKQHFKKKSGLRSIFFLFISFCQFFYRLLSSVFNVAVLPLLAKGPLGQMCAGGFPMSISHWYGPLQMHI